MGKAIKFNYEGTDYTLEYTKGSIKAMEADGFDYTKITSMPDTMITKLWDGAFLAHHRFTKKDVVQKIYEKMPNKENLLNRLIELYTEPINSLMKEPVEGEQIDWE